MELKRLQSQGRVHQYVASIPTSTLPPTDAGIIHAATSCQVPRICILCLTSSSHSAMVHHESSGAIAIVEHLRYDADARAQALLLARAVGKAWGVTETRSTGTGSDLVAFCKERPDLGPAAVVTKRTGAPGDVVFVFGPTKADGWVSQGTCAAALATARLELER